LLLVAGYWLLAVPGVVVGCQLSVVWAAWRFGADKCQRSFPSPRSSFIAAGRGLGRGVLALLH
jgi:hypothetical protein